MNYNVVGIRFHGNDSTNELLVTRIDPDSARKYAAPILDVLADAYERQFEQEMGLLPEGTARTHFDATSPERVDQQRRRMGQYMSSGSAYCVASLSDDIVGVAKTSPSRASVFQKARVARPNCYINDVAVSEPRIGIGSALLYVALGDFSVEKEAVTDALPGNDRFFEAAGMNKQEPQPSQSLSIQIGSSELAQVRFEAFKIQTMKRALELSKPWLTEAETFRSS